MRALKRLAVPVVIFGIIFAICLWSDASAVVAFFIAGGISAYIFIRQDIEDLSTRVEHIEKETLGLGPLPDD